MDINKKIEEKFKSFDEIDRKAINKSKSKNEKVERKFIKFIHPIKSRNRSTIETKKEATFEFLYNFKTYFSQEKCCHPLHDSLNRYYIVRKINNNSLKRSYSINKAFVTTRDSEAFLSNSISKKTKQSFFNIKRTFPFKTQVELGTIDQTNAKNIGESLYNKGIGMKIKNEERIEESLNKLVKEKVPSINKNSKIIANRDSSGCIERLYPRHKVETDRETSNKNIKKRT